MLEFHLNVLWTEALQQVQHLNNLNCRGRLENDINSFELA